MKYFIRAFKYFLYFSVILCLTLGILYLLGFIEGNLDTIFRHGAADLGKIAAIFAVISAVYPKVSFIQRTCKADDEWDKIAPVIKKYFEERSFVLESEAENKLTFRQRSFIGKFSRMYEDRITITKDENILTMDGQRKDVVRFCMGIDYLLNKDK